jgi:hypothetical protein
MSAQLESVIRSYVAKAAITKHAIVGIDTAGPDGTVQIITDPDPSTGLLVVGIAQNAAAPGEDVSVCIFGESFGVAGAAGVPSYGEVMPSLGGTCALHISGGVNPNMVVGRLLVNENYTAAAAADTIRVFVAPRLGDLSA